MVGFAIKRNLQIVSATTSLDLLDGQSVFLAIYESIYNKTFNYSLLSEFQFREFGIIIDSISHRHGGIPQTIVKDNNSSDVLTISLDLAGCMIFLDTDYLLLNKLQ
jgi:hypothetical protein